MSADTLQLHAAATLPPSLTPGLQLADPATAYWIAQVTLRLRREISWCWHQRAGRHDPGEGQAPPFTDPAQESLDIVRYQHDKRRFFQTDVAARYLSDQLAATAASEVPGPWTDMARELALDPAAQFVFALALSARLDASLGPVFAAVHNDANRPFATLALAQRLWDDPLAIVACADGAHPLFRQGLLSSQADPGHASHWQQPIEVPGLVARALIDPARELPPMLQAVTPRPGCVLDSAAGLLAQLREMRPAHMQVVPLIGPRGSDYAQWAATLLAHSASPVADRGYRLVKLADDFPPERAALAALASYCRLRRLDVLLPEHWFDSHEHKAEPWSGALLAIPVRWYAPGAATSCCKPIPAFALTPALAIKALDFNQRVAQFTRGLGVHAKTLAPAIAEAAKRFRFQEKTIDTVTAALAGSTQTPTADELYAACRTAATNELDNLAQPVTPRFRLQELVLPPAQAQQLREAVGAMRTLATVHYGWGTAQAWSESGLSLLFCGPPGTGKTMAAEAIAAELNMPMYRIDLSQVVNKYIGETEKNLKRIFDAAELSDCVLLFDEADALFGKRTDVKDAHDRFANIEISYLLERMERFKGLAVLATNRRKDLDEAFTRRLRYIIEFPLPGIPERERIWRRVFPAAVDVEQVDFAYLARQFQLAGGHIRSIAFNACLQAAAKEAQPRVGMADVLIAVKRELDKMNRPANKELFAPHERLLTEQLA